MSKKKSALVRLGSSSITIQDINEKKTKELRAAARGLAQIKACNPVTRGPYKQSALVRLGSSSITIQDVNEKKSKELRTAVRGLAQIKACNPVTRTPYKQR